MKQQTILLDDLNTSPEVQLAYSQLHTVIDNLDTHVQDLIKRHQSQFMLAYRNHLLKVKDELTLLKKKNQDQQRLTSGVTKIDKLERQVALFREQALKVYNKFQDKNKECQQHKAKLIDANQTIRKYEDNIKQLTRRLKGTEVRNKQIETKLLQLQEGDHEIQQQIDKHQKTFKQGKESLANTPNQSMRVTGVLNQTNFSLQEILKNQFTKATTQEVNGALVKINALIKARQADINNRLLSFRKKQLMSQLADSNAMSFQLKEWFLQCIKSVKKQIQKRNPNIEKERKELENVKSIQQFLRIDKLRLLQIFISDERLLSFIYNKLFPDRVIQIQNFLMKKKVEEEDDFNKQLQQEYIEHLQQIDKPKVIMAKNKKKKQSVCNRVTIKNGKLMLNG